MRLRLFPSIFILFSDPEKKRTLTAIKQQILVGKQPSQPPSQIALFSAACYAGSRAAIGHYENDNKLCIQTCACKSKEVVLSSALDLANATEYSRTLLRTATLSETGPSGYTGFDALREYKHYTCTHPRS